MYGDLYVIDAYSLSLHAQSFTHKFTYPLSLCRDS